MADAAPRRGPLRLGARILRDKHTKHGGTPPSRRRYDGVLIPCSYASGAPRLITMKLTLLPRHKAAPFASILNHAPLRKSEAERRIFQMKLP